MTEPQPPRIDTATLPETERQPAFLVQRGLQGLEFYSQCFGDTLNLFDFCSAQVDHFGAQKKVRSLIEVEQSLLDYCPRWKSVAGRDGAMTIYHFGIACEGIRASLGLCPELGKTVDHQRLRKALRGFRKYFPQFEKMRNSVAHAADKIKTPRKLEEHSIAHGYEGLAYRFAKGAVATVSNEFIDRHFANSWQGELLSYELSQETWDKLANVKVAVWTAFRPLEPGVSVAPAT